MLSEFKPALRFLFVFLALYLVGNLVYGLWIEMYNPRPDPMTRIVTNQTGWVINHLGYSVDRVDNANGPTVYLKSNLQMILNIYEGCNGINVLIVFVAFVIAFKGPVKKMLAFLLFGVVVIHLTNIVRLVLLYWVAIGYQRYFYYVHKYFFTAAIYAVVFLLWLLWIKLVHGKPSEIKQAA